MRNQHWSQHQGEQQLTPNRAQFYACMSIAEVRRRKTKVNAQSRMDFLSKLNIALKEADETEYWLDLLHETKFLDDKMYDSINKNCVELIKLLTASIKKLKYSNNCPLSLSLSLEIDSLSLFNYGNIY